MSEIKYMIKPEWISWDSVQECQRRAHETNNVKGFHMTVQDITGDQLRKQLGDGLCFIALDDDKVVGVFGLKFFKGRNWWSWGKKVAYNCMDGILPEYQGSDVYFGLQDLRMDYINKSDAQIIQSNTSEKNKLILKIAKKKGFKQVRYSATGKGANYYSIIMAKWINGCPYSDKFCNFMFYVSRIVIRTIWKPGYRLRLPFN